MDFQAIVLSDSGDFLVEEEKHVQRTSKGVEVENPWIMTEEEKAQQVQANQIFIPYTSIQNIQYGNFKQETIK